MLIYLGLVQNVCVKIDMNEWLTLKEVGKQHWKIFKHSQHAKNNFL